MEKLNLSSDRFLDKFNERETIEVAGGKVEIVDVSPELEEGDVEKRPILIAPAWGYKVEEYTETIRTLVKEQKRRVLSLTHSRTGHDEEAFAEIPDREKYPEEELRKALNILGVLEHKDLHDVDIIGHSEGGINATIATVLDRAKEKRISALELVASGGLIGDDKVTRLLKGFSDFARPKSLDGSKDPNEKGVQHEIPETQMEKNIIDQTIADGKDYFLANPRRAWREIQNIAGSKINEMIEHLHDSDVDVIIMAMVDDKVFPIEKVMENLNPKKLRGFLSVRGGHYGELANHPEIYGVMAEKMLEAARLSRERDDEGGEKTEEIAA